MQAYRLIDDIKNLGKSSKRIIKLEEEVKHFANAIDKINKFLEENKNALISYYTKVSLNGNTEALLFT